MTQEELETTIADWLFTYDTKFRGTNKDGAKHLVSYLKDLNLLNLPIDIKDIYDPENSIKSEITNSSESY